MRALSLLSVVGLAAALLTGCGDDTTTPPPSATYLKYKQGATYTYNTYQRDDTNKRIDGSKQVVIWTVLKADTTYQSQGSVAMIAQATYDGSGATVLSRDTIFVQSDGTSGKVSQYDVMGEFFGRVPLAAQYRDSVAKTWSQIGDTKTTGTTSWQTAPEATVNNVMIPLGPTTVSITAFVKMSANHKGAVNSVVPAGTFATAYRTDHTVGIRATAFGSTVLNDSLIAHYEFDNAAGLIRKSLDSKALTLQGTTQVVPGFEMELTAYTVPQ